VSENRGKVLAGFLLSGFLLALLGALLPAWGYHRDPPEFAEVGHYFLSLAAGVILSAWVARAILRRREVTFLLVFACSVACASLGFLAVFCPPASPLWRDAGLLVLGVGAGWLNLSLFYAMPPAVGQDLAGAAIRGGIFYGLGCLAATILVAGTFYAYTVPSILLFMAAVPCMFALMYADAKIKVVRAPHPSLEQAYRDFRSPGAVLLALLLFFQFGNEWSIAGWLPLFLIRRVGLSPKSALTVLAFYWFCLLTGRLAAVSILPRVRHARLLLGSVFSALFGCVILFLTNNAFGAGTGAFFVGAGYACIYPLVAEKIGSRFPYYHPGFFSGVFSFAIIGGLLAPATLGYAAEWFGIGVVMALPLMGTCMVVALLLLIWLESKISGQ